MPVAVWAATSISGSTSDAKATSKTFVPIFRGSRLENQRGGPKAKCFLRSSRDMEKRYVQLHRVECPVFVRLESVAQRGEGAVRGLPSVVGLRVVDDCPLRERDPLKCTRLLMSVWGRPQ
jgi:hypothetical protein